MRQGGSSWNEKGYNGIIVMILTRHVPESNPSTKTFICSGTCISQGGGSLETWFVLPEILSTTWSWNLFDYLQGVDWFKGRSLIASC